MSMEECFSGDTYHSTPTIGDIIGKDEIPCNDKVNHPSYYNTIAGVECIDVVRHMDFNIGNAMKYLWRAGHKSEKGYTDKQKQIEDLKKAIFYINDEIYNVLKEDEL